MAANTSTKRAIDRERLIRPARLAHFVLRTPNFGAMRSWYESVLGAKAVFENDFLCFMTYDEEHHRVALINMPQVTAKDEGAAGVDHIAFTFTDLGDLLSTFARLKIGGIAPYWSINHGPTTSLYYRDPDSNQIELQIDNFQSAQEADDFVRSGAFEKNPIGVEFDPEKLLERYENGDAIEDLIQQGSA